jgi:alkyl hydroperoxide reductase subunit AhpC
MNMIQEPALDFVADAVLPGGVIGKVALNQYRGKWVVLFFYPLDFTFVCPTEIISFAERQSEFASLNCQLLAVSCDSVYTHLSWCEQPRSEGGLGQLPIPILSDYTKEIAKNYKVLTNDGVPLRASFLISPEGKL